MAGLEDACAATLQRVGALRASLGDEEVRSPVPARPGRTVGELLTELLGPAVGQPEERLVELVVGEHDLRGALRRPGARGAPEVRTALQLQLEAVAPALKQAGAGVLVVDAGGASWASHVGRRGCTLLVDPWTASRVLAGRRTAAEVRALPHRGDVERVVGALGALPVVPLDEA